MHIAMTRYGDLWCAESEECVICPDRGMDFVTALNKVIASATDQGATRDERDIDVIYIVFHVDYEGYAVPESWAWHEVVDLHELELIR